MLIILSGDIQIGKTRWLCDLSDSLFQQGVLCWGVLAPGVWETQIASENLTREKVGIDNILLPQKEKIAFAQRRDLHEKNYPARGDASLTSESDAAQLVWAISDAAIGKVNLHFEHIEARCSCETNTSPGLLIIDELGRLELIHRKGLVSATSLLAKGPTVFYEHALVVVRESLVPQMHESFASFWPEVITIGPSAQSACFVHSLYALEQRPGLTTQDRERN